MNKIILFDFFGVISTEIAPFWLEKFFNQEQSQLIKEAVVGPGDLGINDEAKIYNELSRLTGVKPNQIAIEWMELVKIDTKLVELIRMYRKHHKVYLLSNAVSTFLNNILNKYQLKDLFNDIFISSEMGLAKPDKKFFEYVLNKIQADKSQMIFIDDNIRNVNSAKDLGITSILFENTNDIRDKINSFIASSK